MKLTAFYSLQTFLLAFLLGACTPEPIIVYRTEYIEPDPPPTEWLQIQPAPDGRPVTPLNPNGTPKGPGDEWTDEEIEAWWRGAMDWEALDRKRQLDNCLKHRGLAILFDQVPGDVCGSLDE